MVKEPIVEELAGEEENLLEIRAETHSWQR